MRALWKFFVPFGDGVIEMPVAEVVGVGVQGMDVVLWARCDPESPFAERPICGLPTGAHIPDEWLHHGVVQRPDGIVIHVVERR